MRNIDLNISLEILSSTENPDILDVTTVKIWTKLATVVSGGKFGNTVFPQTCYAKEFDKLCCFVANLVENYAFVWKALQRR